MTPIIDETDTNVYTSEELDLAEVSPTDILAARDAAQTYGTPTVRGLLNAETDER